jgi:hypothetical protein
MEMGIIGIQAQDVRTSRAQNCGGTPGAGEFDRVTEAATSMAADGCGIRI